MKPLNTSDVLNLGTLDLFSTFNANSGCYNYHFEKMEEIKGLSADKICIDSIEKELLHQVEA